MRRARCRYSPTAPERSALNLANRYGYVATVGDTGHWRAFRRRLEELPSNPVHHYHPRRLVTRAKRGADFMGHLRWETSRFFATINPYPRPFEHVWLRSADQVRIAAWVGPRRPTQPSEWGLVLVPGMFSTKDDTIHKRRAIHIWRHWKIPVACIDLRGFGESRGVSTAGWKEALDVEAAAKHLRDVHHVKRVAVIAESLGGAAAINAVANEGERGGSLFDGGLLTWSAFVDARDAVEYISAQPPEDHPFANSWAGFRRLLHLKSMGGYQRFTDLIEDVARTNGLPDVEALYALASPKSKVKHIRNPALLIHATDDPVVPVRHARRMERYAGDADHVQTMVVPWGMHTQFEAIDPTWYWEVTRRFFGEVNHQELPVPRGRR